MGEFKKFRRLWFALILVFGISGSHAWAEIENAKDIYEEYIACDTYLGFLDDMRSLSGSRLDDCHDLALLPWSRSSHAYAKVTTSYLKKRKAVKPCVQGGFFIAELS